MQRPKVIVWISSAILVGILHGAVPTEVNAQPPSLTRELDGAPRGDRWAQHFPVHFVVNDWIGFETITPVIPAGKKLVLQSASIHTVMTHGQGLMEAYLALRSGRTTLAYLYVDMDFQAAETQGPVDERERHFTGNRDINMVLNAGESIGAAFLRNGSQGIARQNYSHVALIGYFVDVDPLTPPSP